MATQPRTVHDEIDFLRMRLAHLVAHFNEGGEWEAGLKAQVAVVAVDQIAGCDGVDFETGYER